MVDWVNQTNPFAGSLIPLWPDLEITRNQYATAEERHIFGPAAVNLFRVSFVHTHSGRQPDRRGVGARLVPEPRPIRIR